MALPDLSGRATHSRGPRRPEPGARPVDGRLFVVSVALEQACASRIRLAPRSPARLASSEDARWVTGQTIKVDGGIR
jgi:NAD(P)-dependent dehydrogenase (short-subunit alcohol dehydrogenase family)